MKKAKAPRVPVLENAFEVNLPKMIRAVKATGDARVVLDDGVTQTVAVLAEKRLAVFLGGRQWVTDIVPVQCLGGRVRPLLKCPRAHEGNFQSLYYQSGSLACRLCHQLRYRTTLSTSISERLHIARSKLISKMGGGSCSVAPVREKRTWRHKYMRRICQLSNLTATYHAKLKQLKDKP